ncbi:uncharacterized protein TrAtP1_012697 [Trichoderma atroviride]|uniref:uncharacterized protein n=1 Tax=Hypocrea atroviridis TaxID=63577 RepID=UPI00331D2DD3|nr:hypothetical protein TrAtP1_012697 [Trichoderma atroviride]
MPPLHPVAEKGSPGRHHSKLHENQKPSFGKASNEASPNAKSSTARLSARFSASKSHSPKAAVEPSLSRWGAFRQPSSQARASRRFGVRVGGALPESLDGAKSQVAAGSGLKVGSGWLDGPRSRQY